MKALAKMQPIAAQVEDRVVPFIFLIRRRCSLPRCCGWKAPAPVMSPDHPVLRGLNLRIDQDDRIALFGQNGNGKSTFAKLLSGRLAPLTGQVFGVAAASRSAISRSISSTISIRWRRLTITW